MWRAGRWTDGSKNFVTYWGEGRLLSAQMLETSDDEMDPIYKFWVFKAGRQGQVGDLEQGELKNRLPCNSVHQTATTNHLPIHMQFRPPNSHHPAVGERSRGRHIQRREHRRRWLGHIPSTAPPVEYPSNGKPLEDQAALAYWTRYHPRCTQLRG